MKRFLTLIILAGAVLLAVPALAANDKPPAKGASGAQDDSGVITMEQLAKDMQYLQAEWQGIVVHYVLPKGWELQEQYAKEDAKQYTVTSHSLTPDKDTPPDMIFELTVFSRGLLDDLPADASEADKTGRVQFRNFLDEQISINLKAGLKCKTKPADIVPKGYGPTTRPPTFFVPIQYDTPWKEKLYTFTTVTADKIWMVKFLIKENQVENYGALVALMLFNTFGMTAAEEKELRNK